MIDTTTKQPRHVPLLFTKAARTKVLNTNELLEHILLHLPLRQLLFAQRVNKRFRATIRDTPRIKQALFIDPSSTERVQWTHGKGRRHPSRWLEVENGNEEHISREDSTVVLVNPFTEV